MLLLAADIGNAHTVLGLLEDGEVVAHWRFSTDERRTADEWSVLIRGLLGDQDRVVEGIAVCATVPSVLHEWRDMLRLYHGDVPQVIVEPGVRTGVPVLMDNPREVGTDRIINALAASQLFDGPAIVVDFGTATTFDVVSARGEYVGGEIDWTEFFEVLAGRGPMNAERVRARREAHEEGAWVREAAAEYARKTALRQAQGPIDGVAA